MFLRILHPWVTALNPSTRLSALDGAAPAGASSSRGAASRLPLSVPALLLAAAMLLPFGMPWLAGAVSAPVSLLTRDPVAVGNLPPWTGLLSTLGLCAWAAAATVALFAGAWVRERGGATAVPAGWFFGAGALSVVLLLDDAFLAHEILLPVFVGIPEKAVYAMYGLAALAWFVGGLRFLRGTPWLLLGIAGLGFAASVVIDVVSGDNDPAFTVLLEDGAKWIGIAAWAAYLSATAWSAVAPVPTAASGDRRG